MAFDWQTVVVTIVAMGAAAVIVRRFVPARRQPSGGAASMPAACDHCETGAKAVAAPSASSGATAGARTQTTPVVSVQDLRASAKRR
jgi:hypothetical protein